MLEESNVTNNEGNFRELLRFRIEAGDKTLEEHLRNTSSRATYISKRTQNELIECCKDEILSVIVKKISDAKYYSIMFDETTDIAHVSQMSIVIRYLEGNNVREDFVSFIDCHSENYELSPDTLEPVLNGTILGKSVIKQVQKFRLPLENCVGICTDGCSVMTSKQQGAVQEIQKEMNIAVRCPCFNHALNLSLSKSSNVQCVRNAVGVMKEIISFFKASSKRNYVLKQTLGDQLSGLCETRWVERHDSVLQFKASIEKILQALNLISEWNERESSSKARTHILAISSNCSFIITLFCLNEVLAITLPLSKLLQTKNLAISSTQNAVLNTLLVLKDKRNNAETNFNALLKEIMPCLENLNIDLCIPRVNKFMKNRPNPDIHSSTEYFRITIYIPLLESIISDIECRFQQETMDVFNLQICVPAILIHSNEDDIHSAVEILIAKYGSLFETVRDVLKSTFIAELHLWKMRWKHSKESEIPSDDLNALIQCDEMMYPIINKILKILCTLPVSVASAERSFSGLRRLKSWLRANMGEERLTGLALMHVHKDIVINEDNIIERFAKSGVSRNIEFVM